MTQLQPMTVFVVVVMAAAKMVGNMFDVKFCVCSHVSKSVADVDRLTVSTSVTNFHSLFANVDRQFSYSVTVLSGKLGTPTTRGL